MAAKLSLQWSEKRLITKAGGSLGLQGSGHRRAILGRKWGHRHLLPVAYAGGTFVHEVFEEGQGQLDTRLRLSAQRVGGDVGEDVGHFGQRLQEGGWLHRERAFSRRGRFLET